MDIKNVIHVAIIFVSPNVMAIAPVNKLSLNTKTDFALANAAFEDVLSIKRIGSVFDVFVCAFESKTGVFGNDVK